MAAGHVVALALAVVLLPLALIVTYMLRFVFLNQHSLPTAGFLVGPEDPAAVERDVDDAERALRRGTA